MFRGGRHVKAQDFCHSDTTASKGKKAASEDCIYQSDFSSLISKIIKK